MKMVITVLEIKIVNIYEFGNIIMVSFLPFHIFFNEIKCNPKRDKKL